MILLRLQKVVGVARQQPSATGQESGSRLGASWPDFIEQLDSDPERCFAGLYSFAKDLLRICPPAALRGLTRDLREDVVHDLVLHCCKDDFRVLRSYRDRGRPFAAWLQLVVRNRFLDTVRREKRANVVSLDDDPDSTPLQVPDPEATARVDGGVDRDMILDKVRAALTVLTDKCRLLVQGAADGYKPRELVRLMGWPADWNKKASDDLRECRKNLRRLLAADGIDPGAFR